MKPEVRPPGGAASHHAHAADHPHEHAQGNVQGHPQSPEHSHRHAHGHGSHAHAPKAPPATAVIEPRPSLLMSSASWRLAGAVGLIALLWVAVAWALSGTP